MANKSDMYFTLARSARTLHEEATND